VGGYRSSQTGLTVNRQLSAVRQIEKSGEFGGSPPKFLRKFRWVIPSRSGEGCGSPAGVETSE
jgi:hypothetical protein